MKFSVFLWKFIVDKEYGKPVFQDLIFSNVTATSALNGSRTVDNVRHFYWTILKEIMRKRQNNSFP